MALSVELERELAVLAVSDRPPEKIKTMSDMVTAADIAEVPQAARMIAEQMTASNDMIATETEALAAVLMDKAAALRRANDRVCQDMRNLLVMAQQLHNLRQATAADYAAVSTVDG